MSENYFDASEQDALVRLPFVKAFSGKGKTQIYHDMAQNTFPKNVSIGSRSRAWLLSELVKWRDSKIAERDKGTKK
jgi:prophage regulatory protein